MWISLPIFLGLGVIETFGPQLLGSFFHKIPWQVHSVAWIIHEPAGSLFYISSLVTLMTSRPKWIHRLTFLGPIGRMALTNYLLQSVAGTFLYYGYGLGLYSKMGLFSGFLLTITVFALQIVLSFFWLSRFQFGPCEWFWRSLTYLRLQPLRKH